MTPARLARAKERQDRMIARIALLICLVAGAAWPARADHDHQAGTWGSLLPPEHPGDRGGVPMVAPPVVIAPLFDAAPRRLPNLCLQAVDTPDGWRRFYDGACLDRHGRAGDLPRVCRVRLTTWGAIRRGYDAQCLFDAGYLREE